MFNDMMLGVLSWKAPETLRATLENHARFGLPGLFARAVVYLQEGSEEEAAIARANGYEPMVAAENGGILPGVSALADELDAPFLVLLENDHQVVEPPEVALDALRRARADLEDEGLAVMRLRSRSRPGTPYRGVEKYLRAWGVKDRLESDLPYLPGSGLERLLRQTLRRSRESVRLGAAIHVERRPEERFPFAIRRGANGNFITDSRYAGWTNQCYMIRRKTLREEILARAAPNAMALPPAERTLETNLPKGWWNSGGFKVGYSDPGVFTHVRLDR